MRIRWIGSLVVSLAAVQGCGDSGTTTARRGDGGPGTGCGKDTDCKGDRICVAGECVSPSGDSGSGATGGSSTAGTGGGSSGTGGSAGIGGRSTGGRVGAGGTANAGGATTGGADSGAPGGAGSGGAGGRGAGGRGAGGAGPQCTPQDTSACPPTFPFGPCCTGNGTCGITYPPFGCVPTGGNFDAGTGAGGSPTGGGLVSAACINCRSLNCSSETLACDANAACAALRTCIDSASPFNLLNCLTGVTTQARTLYNALSSCASTSCTSAPCPNINI